jgi:hypothetical protein
VGVVIVLATPTRESLPASYVGDLVRLLRRHPDMKFAAPIGIYIANLRNQAVTLARAVGASHLLFIDADMRFPAETADRLLAANQDIVAANYVQRTLPEWCVARRDGQPVPSQGRTGLEAVDAVGCGVMLIRTAVFEAIPSPWFSTPWLGGAHQGEDVYFCQQARVAGLAVWIDHDLSQRVRHQGTVELGVRSSAVALEPVVGV